MSLFNLIVYSELKNRKQHCESLVKAISDKFPCKIFYIHLSDKTKVIKQQKSHNGDKDFSSDILHLYGKAEDIPLLIYPNLLSDLPIYCIWDDHIDTKNRLLNTLLPLVTRAIFDSALENDLHTFCRSLTYLSDRHQVECLDMNWVRMRAWRLAFSLIFNSKERIEKLKKANTIEVTFNGLSDPSFCLDQAQSYYLTSWLKAQLKIDEKQTNITFIRKQNNLFEPCSILKVKIKSKDTYFELTLKPSPSLNITVNISTQLECQIPLMIPLPRLSRSRVFFKHLFYSGMSQHFQNSLKTLTNQVKNQIL